MGKLKQYKGALTFVGLFSLVTLGFSNWIASFSINAPILDPSIGESELGIYFTFIGTVLFFSQPLIVRPINERYSEKYLVTIGAFLGLLGFVMLPFADTYGKMFFANTPLILGISFLNPSITSVISKTVPRNMQGETMGISQSLASLMRVIGPLLAGALLDVNMFFPYYVGGIIFILIVILLFLYVKYPDE